LCFGWHTSVVPSTHIQPTTQFNGGSVAFELSSKSFTSGKREKKIFSISQANRLLIGWHVVLFWGQFKNGPKEGQKNTHTYCWQ